MYQTFVTVIRPGAAGETSSSIRDFDQSTIRFWSDEGGVISGWFLRMKVR